MKQRGHKSCKTNY